MDRTIITTLFAFSALTPVLPAIAYDSQMSDQERVVLNERYYSNHNAEDEGVSGEEFYLQGKFRAPKRYQRPDGYSAHYWSSGEHLPKSYRKHRYRIDNDDYRLREPPDDFRWIRVNDDVLLTNMDTGRISDVVRNLFYSRARDN